MSGSKRLAWWMALAVVIWVGGCNQEARQGGSAQQEEASEAAAAEGLPEHQGGGLRASASGGSDGEAAAATSGRKLLFLGDSLVEGYGIPADQAFPSVVEARLREKGYEEISVFNAGIAGFTSAGAKRLLNWHLRGKTKPYLMLLVIGGNDGLRGIEVDSSRQNLVDIVQRAKKHGIKVLLAGMRVPPNLGREYTEKFHAMYREVAESEAIPLIPFLLDKVGGEKELNLPDGIHPNVAGHSIIADTVIKHLEPLL